MNCKCTEPYDVYNGVCAACMLPLPGTVHDEGGRMIQGPTISADNHCERGIQCLGDKCSCRPLAPTANLDVLLNGKNPEDLTPLEKELLRLIPTDNNPIDTDLNSEKRPILERDELKARCHDLEIRCDGLQAALEAIASNGDGRGMGWTAAQCAREALAFQYANTQEKK